MPYTPMPHEIHLPSWTSNNHVVEQTQIVEEICLPAGFVLLPQLLEQGQTSRWNKGKGAFAFVDMSSDISQWLQPNL